MATNTFRLAFFVVLACASFARAQTREAVQFSAAVSAHVRVWAPLEAKDAPEALAARMSAALTPETASLMSLAAGRTVIAAMKDPASAQAAQDYLRANGEPDAAARLGALAAAGMELRSSASPAHRTFLDSLDALAEKLPHLDLTSPERTAALLEEFYDEAAPSEHDEMTKAAADPKTPAWAIEELAQKHGPENERIRAAAAGNAGASQATLLMLAGDESREVRAAVASNPAASFSALKLLTQVREPTVEITPQDVLNASGVAEPTIEQRRAAMWEAAERNAEIKKSKDTASEEADRAIRETAHRRLLQAADRDSDIAQNPETTPQTLALLAKDPRYGIRMTVAKNPSTPAEVLTTLSRESILGVRLGVAKNPRAPTEVLRALTRDASYDVRETAAATLRTRTGF